MTALDLTLVTPWSSDTPDLLTRTLTHLARPAVTLPDGSEVTLDVEDGRLSFDENRVPRVELSMACRLPTDAAQLALLDPRTACRVTLAAGYRRPNGVEDVQDVVDLDLRDRNVDRPRDVIELVARSDEAIVLDDSPTNGATLTGTSVVDAITKAILLSIPAATVDSTAMPGGGIGPATTVYPMTDKWDTIADLADRIGAHVYDAGKRGWVIAPAQGAIAAPAALLATGPTGTVTDVKDALTRDDDWYNRVQLTYQWRDGAGQDRRLTAVRQVNTGPYAATVGSVKTNDVRRDVPTTNAGAIAAADSLLARGVTRGRLTRVTAVSTYWLRPGHTVEVAFPTGEVELHLVSAVEFDLRTGLMTVTTRLPDNTAGTGSAGGLLLDDDFERFDGPLGIPAIGNPWSAPSFLITGGKMEQTQTNSTPQLALTDVGVLDHDVEADFTWNATAGIGLVFRARTTATFLLLTMESGGSAYRLYKFVSGTPTLLATFVGTSTSGVTYNSRATIKGNLIEVWLDGTPLGTHDLTGDPNVSTFSAANATQVGVRNNRNASTMHHYTERITARETV